MSPIMLNSDGTITVGSEDPYKTTFHMIADMVDIILKKTGWHRLDSTPINLEHFDISEDFQHLKGLVANIHYDDDVKLFAERLSFTTLSYLREDKAIMADLADWKNTAKDPDKMKRVAESINHHQKDAARLLLELPFTGEEIRLSPVDPAKKGGRIMAQWNYATDNSPKHIMVNSHSKAAASSAGFFARVVYHDSFHGLQDDFGTFHDEGRVTGAFHEAGLLWNLRNKEDALIPPALPDIQVCQFDERLAHTAAYYFAEALIHILPEKPRRQKSGETEPVPAVA